MISSSVGTFARAITARPAAVLLWCAVATLLAVDYWGLRLFHGRFDHEKAGSLGEWFAGILSAGAISVALWANHITQSHYAMDKEERRERERTDLAVWTEDTVDDNNRHAWHAVFRNETGYPIYVWSVSVEGTNAELVSERLGPIVPGENRFRLEGMPAADAVLSLPCTLTFEDRTGMKWIVDGRGNRSADRGPDCKRE